MYSFFKWNKIRYFKYKNKFTEVAVNPYKSQVRKFSIYSPNAFVNKDKSEKKDFNPKLYPYL